MHNYSELLDQRKYTCRQCKKSFAVPYYVHDWGYWYAGKICCSYTCMRALEAKDKKPVNEPEVHVINRNTRPPLTKKEVKKIEQLLCKGISARQTAKLCNRSESAVSKIRKRMAAEGWTIGN